MGHGEAHREPTLILRCVSAGVAAGMADLATHPLETLKVRLQVQGERLAYKPRLKQPSQPLATTHPGNHGQKAPIATGSPQSVAQPGMLRTLYRIVTTEGPLVLYNGLTASVQRQLVFASIRIGCYDTVRDCYVGLLLGEKRDNLGVMGVALRILAAMTTCSIGVMVTQPMDLVKLRMQAMPTGGQIQHRYTGLLQAYRTIITTEGLPGMWKGTVPNVTRHSIASASELVTYDVVKQRLLRLEVPDSVACHFISALSAGLVTTIITNPIDVVKTRVMNSETGVYSGILSCARALLRDEGPSAFYKGFLPFYCRMGSWNLVMFLCYEQVKKLCTKAS